METNNNVTQKVADLNNWLVEEIKSVSTNNFSGERLEGLKIADKQMVEVSIDFTKPFEKWQDPISKTIKKIIPVTLQDGSKRAFWLNCANPLYKELLELGKAGQTKFSIARTGMGKATRYTLIKH